jgi:hypothetical protein
VVRHSSCPQTNGSQLEPLIYVTQFTLKMSVWWYIKVQQSTCPFMNAPGNGPGSGEKVNCKLNRSLAWDDDRDTPRLRRRRRKTEIANRRERELEREKHACPSMQRARTHARTHAVSEPDPKPKWGLAGASMSRLSPPPPISAPRSQAAP